MVLAEAQLRKWWDLRSEAQRAQLIQAAQSELLHPRIVDLLVSTGCPNGPVATNSELDYSWGWPEGVRRFITERVHDAIHSSEPKGSPGSQPTVAEAFDCQCPSIRSPLMRNAAPWAITAGHRFREVARTTENETTKALAEGLVALTEALRELDAKLEKIHQQARSNTVA